MLSQPGIGSSSNPPSCRTSWLRAVGAIAWALLFFSTCLGAVSAAQEPAVNNPPPANVKPGSIDDVNAIGSRNIGGRGLGNWYSTDAELNLGRQYAAQLDRSTKFVSDPVVNEYINRVAQNLVRNSDAKIPFTVKVIDANEVNAFALPGGFFYVNSGLILAADSESELAGVMAHEISHVIAHHAARQMTRAQYAQLGSIPLIMVGGMAGYAAYEVASVAIPVTFLKFSRQFEAQADYLGVQYLYKAGYDPQSFIAFFEKIETLEKHKPGTMSKMFEDHPPTPDRIKASQEEIARILPPRDQYVVDTSEFQDVKARLGRIENRKLPKDDKGDTSPTLRRAGSSNPNEKNGQTSADDGPPVLSRPAQQHLGSMDNGAGR